MSSTENPPLSTHNAAPTSFVLIRHFSFILRGHYKQVPHLFFLLQHNWCVDHVFCSPLLAAWTHTWGEWQNRRLWELSWKGTAHLFCSELGGNTWRLVCRRNAVTHTDSHSHTHKLWPLLSGTDRDPLTLSLKPGELKSPSTDRTVQPLILCDQCSHRVVINLDNAYTLCDVLLVFVCACVCVGEVCVRLVNQQKETKQATESNLSGISNDLTSGTLLRFIHSAVFGLVSPAA